MTLDDRAHLTDEQLHGLADGTLAVPARAAVVSHLDACGECATVVERLRRVLDAAASAPRTIEPPRDLWPDIRSRIRGEGAREVTNRHGWRYYAGLAAAAVVLVVASSVVTREAVLKGSQRGLPTSAATSGATLVEYDRLDRELAALLAAHRRALRPETIATVERNLAIIDQAIAEIRAALIEDPENAALRDLLRASYGQKRALLQQLSQT